MTALALLLHGAYLLIAPILLSGLVARTKAIWGGRKGPRLTQTWWDLLRLLRKRSVYSSTTTLVFRVGAPLVFGTTLLGALMVPVLPGFAPFSFSADWIVVAYVFGLGRLFTVLSALDTGSPFEGMGASREALFSALAEPALFLCLGAIGLLTQHPSLAAMTRAIPTGPADALVLLPALIALFILLQTEAARVPVDDPLTHLELTMIHEVMILDHSGPELAALQGAAALKLAVYAGLIASFLNPVPASVSPVLSAMIAVVLTALVAIGVGCVESLIARLKMRAVPWYVGSAALFGLLALLASTIGRAAA
ncbi:MAG: NADH-quinone oxidoreductase subunit H [Myxococcota bacterium]